MSFIDVDEFVDPSPSLPVTVLRNVVHRSVDGLHVHRNEFDDDSMATRRK